MLGVGTTGLADKRFLRLAYVFRLRLTKVKVGLR
jgi:hypothetical protein